MTTFRITNRDLFEDVDTDGLNYCRAGDFYRGSISIEISGEWKTITGDHDPGDYEEEYGFVLIWEND